MSISSPSIHRSWDWSAYDVDIIDLFPPVADGFVNGVVSEPFWDEEHLSAAEEGRAPSLTTELCA